MRPLGTGSLTPPSPLSGLCSCPKRSLVPGRSLLPSLMAAVAWSLPCLSLSFGPGWALPNLPLILGAPLVMQSLTGTLTMLLPALPEGSAFSGIMGFETWLLLGLTRLGCSLRRRKPVYCSLTDLRRARPLGAGLLISTSPLSTGLQLHLTWLLRPHSGWMPCNKLGLRQLQRPSPTVRSSANTWAPPQLAQRKAFALHPWLLRRLERGLLRLPRSCAKLLGVQPHVWARTLLPLKHASSRKLAFWCAVSERVPPCVAVLL